MIQTSGKRIGHVLLAFGVQLGLAPMLAVAATAERPALALEERYVKASANGAKLLNYRDTQSSVWRVVPSGEVLRVTAEQVLEPPGQPKLVFLEVEVPGGLPVWVYGEFLAPSAKPGIVKTTTVVNMRPKPSSDTSSMAHPMKLQADEQLSVIERANPDKPMREDWVKVWSPERARAWVLASETEPWADVAAASQAWAKASALVLGERAQASPAAATTSTPASGTTGEQQAAPQEAAAENTPDEASAALAHARALYEESLAQKGVGIQLAVAAYEQAVELARASSTTRRQAEVGLQQAKSYAEIVALNQQIQDADAERERLREQLKREEELAAKSRDPLWGRFTARGWVSARNVDGERRYYLQWRSEEVCEVVCTVGRYDLGLFENYEIGVMGTVSRGPVPASDEGPAQPELLDLYRIEVISGGARLR